MVRPRASLTCSNGRIVLQDKGIDSRRFMAFRRAGASLCPGSAQPVGALVTLRPELPAPLPLTVHGEVSGLTGAAQSRSWPGRLLYSAAVLNVRVTSSVSMSPAVSLSSTDAPVSRLVAVFGGRE